MNFLVKATRVILSFILMIGVGFILGIGIAGFNDYQTQPAEQLTVRHSFWKRGADTKACSIMSANIEQQDNAKLEAYKHRINPLIRRHWKTFRWPMPFDIMVFATINPDGSLSDFSKVTGPPVDNPLIREALHILLQDISSLSKPPSLACQAPPYRMYLGLNHFVPDDILTFYLRQLRLIER